MHWVGTVLGLLLTLAACGGPPPPPDAGGEPDAGVMVDAGPALSPVAPAAQPNLVCPTGWASLDRGEGTPTVCDPWPEGRASCGPNERQLPGEAACVPIGDPCPSGDFPDGLPASGIVYVRAGATGGDGTRAAPFGTLGEGLDAALDGETVLLAVGEYVDELYSMTRPVTLRGVCLDAVIGRGASVSVRGPEVRIENLRFEGGPRGPVIWAGGATLRSVALRDLGQGALTLQGGFLDLEDVSISDIREGGVRVSADTSLRARRLDITGTRGWPLDLQGEFDIEDLALIQTAAGPPTAGAITFGTGGSGRIERVVIQHEQLATLVVLAADVTLIDLVFRGPPRSTPVDDLTIFVVTAGQLRLERAWLSRLHVLGAIVADPGSRLNFTDTVIEDVGTDSVGGSGYGIVVAGGGSAQLTRVWIEGATRAGVLVTEAGSHVEASDLVVRGTSPTSDGFFGRGVQVQVGATMNGARVELLENREAALIVASGAQATLTDVLVADVAARTCSGCDPAGIGVATYLGGQLDLERFRITRASLIGLQLAFDGDMDLFDGEVFDNPIGVNLQVDGYDLARLTTNVLYRDNGVNLDFDMLAVPEPVAPGL